MAFLTKGWVVRKKRTTKRRGKNMFNELPKEIQTEILKRLGGKDVSKAMCVSNAWRDLILYTTLPKKLESLVIVRVFPYPFLGLEHLFHWCSTVMRCWVTPQNLIDSCNGLLLFCHNKGEAENVTHSVYHYYVVNCVTKQCVAVLKPSGTTSAGYSYAALAYDPTESWFFKIVRFQGYRHIDVFSSETGIWTTLTLFLPVEVNASLWVKKCVYSNGALYRISNSRHLLKILVDPQENVEDQALALTLPPSSLSYRCRRDIGVRDDRVMLVMSIGESFIVYELIECDERGTLTFKWYKIRSINDSALSELNSYGQLLSFHPYHKVAFYKRKNLLFYYFIGDDNDNNNNNGPQEIAYDKTLYDYLRSCGLPLLQCSFPFTCCLVKEHPRLFQQLLIPDITQEE